MPHACPRPPRSFRRRAASLATIVAALAAFGCSSVPPTLHTQLFRQDEATAQTLPVAKLHFPLEHAATRSLRDLLVGSVEVAPGEQLHPPHQHAEEEFLWLVSGSGRWTIGDEEVEARPGDLLYLEPWVMHGILNTGSTPLTFFVVKWNGNGMETPHR